MMGCLPSYLTMKLFVSNLTIERIHNPTFFFRAFKQYFYKTILYKITIDQLRQKAYFGRSLD